MSREELWEKPRHVEVSKMQIRPTPGTFYFCFSESHGHTWLGELLNKKLLGDLGINKRSRWINKVWRNCQTLHAVSRRRRRRRLWRYRLVSDAVAVLMTRGHFLKHLGLFSAG